MHLIFFIYLYYLYFYMLNILFMKVTYTGLFVHHELENLRELKNKYKIIVSTISIQYQFFFWIPDGRNDVIVSFKRKLAMESVESWFAIIFQ